MDGVVGSGDGESAVGGEGELPAAFVGEVVMPAAQWDEVVDVGVSVALRVPGDVVDLAVLESDVAQGASAVKHSERSALRSVGVADGAPEEDPLPTGGDNDGSYVATAHPTADGVDRQPEPGEPDVVHAVLVEPARQGFPVDDHSHIRRLALGGGAGDQGDQSQRGESGYESVQATMRYSASELIRSPGDDGVAATATVVAANDATTPMPNVRRRLRNGRSKVASPIRR